MIPYDYLRKLPTWVISRTPEKTLENNELSRKIESLSEYSFPHDRILLNRYPGPQKKKNEVNARIIRVSGKKLGPQRRVALPLYERLIRNTS